MSERERLHSAGGAKCPWRRPKNLMTLRSVIYHTSSSRSDGWQDPFRILKESCHVPNVIVRLAPSCGMGKGVRVVPGWRLPFTSRPPKWICVNLELFLLDDKVTLKLILSCAMCTLHVLVFIIFNLHVRDLPSFLTQKQIQNYS